MMGAVIAGLLALAAEQDTTMSISTESVRNYPGYRGRLSCQMGCATTGDYPSQATGDHPFTRFRKLLSPGLPDHQSGEIYWQDAQVFLFVRADAPEIVRQKLAVDFILSLAFDPELRRTASFAYPTKAGTTLSGFAHRHDALPMLMAPAAFRTRFGPGRRHRSDPKPGPASTPTTRLIGCSRRRCS
jgi:hypothetical protein